MRIVDKKDGTFNVYYKLRDDGDYTVDLKFGGQPIPNANYNVKVREKS